MAKKPQLRIVWDAVEEFSRGPNEIVDRKTESGTKTWVIRSTISPRVSCIVTVAESDGQVMACAVPSLALDDVELSLPTPFIALGDPSPIAEWMETAIGGSIERADSYFQAASGIPAALVRGGCDGDVRQFPFVEQDGCLGWRFAVKTKIDDETECLTFFVLWAEENNFSLKTQSYICDLDGDPAKVIHEGEISRSVSPTRILAALSSAVPAIKSRYPLPGQVKHVENPYQKLLRAPGAFGPNVVPIKRTKRGESDD